MRTLIALLFLMAIGYFSITWYRYGTSHPCGILKSMMLPYRVNSETKAAMALEHKHSRQGEASHFEDPAIRRTIQQDWQRINAAPEIAAKKLQAEISSFTLSRCIVDVLTWDPPEALPDD